MDADKLQERLMKDAHDRWYITQWVDGEACLDMCVAAPGWEDNFLDIRVSRETEKATVKVESGEYLEAAFELTLDQLIEYLQQLPRPVQSFGRNIYPELNEQGERG